MSSGNFTVEYRPEPGVHRFEASDGTQVAAVAFNDWEQTEQALRELGPIGSDVVVVTPELITTPMPLAEIPEHMDVAAQRLETARQISSLHPAAQFLIGTPSANAAGQLHNSVAMYASGEHRGYLDKRGFIWPAERTIFPADRREQIALPVGRAVLICSDFIYAASQIRVSGQTRMVPEGVRTLIVPACWAVPVWGLENDPRTPDQRYRDPLEASASHLFDALPNLEDIIVIDRSIPETNLPPYTAHFRRATAATTE